eukprot:2419352-Pleurochrysis_carterae.AAC.1
MYSENTLAIRPERVIKIVSMRLNDDLYWSDRGQGWEFRLLARNDRNISLALPIEKTGTVCISPIQRVFLYDVRKFAHLSYMPSDGFSTHDAYSDGYGYDSAPHSLISLMTPEYEPPSFNYSSGLCDIPPRKASMVYGHGVGLLFYWGRGTSVYGSLCNATYFT